MMTTTTETTATTLKIIELAGMLELTDADSEAFANLKLQRSSER